MTTGLASQVQRYRWPFSKASFGMLSPSNKANCSLLAGTAAIISMMYILAMSLPLIPNLHPSTQFYIGRELNPTVRSLDIKSFNELRPGMILWLLIDISMACAQATRLGGHITDSMILVLFFQGLYIMDALYNEVSHPAYNFTCRLPSTISSPQS
jgi:hypothetical protein